MGSIKRLITMLSVGVIVSTLSVAPMASAQTAPVVGETCTERGVRSRTSPYLICQATKVKGKTVLRWAKYASTKPPKGLTGLRRCLWGEWMITGEAFTAYWETVLAAFANAVEKREPSEPGEVTDALADPGPVIFQGDIRFVFSQNQLVTLGSMSTEGIQATSDAVMPYTAVGKSQLAVDVPAGAGFFRVRFEGDNNVSTVDPTQLERVTVDVACSAKSLTWMIPLEGTTPVKVVLVRPPA
jgi:hypothetical protein